MCEKGNGKGKKMSDLFRPDALIAVESPDKLRTILPYTENQLLYFYTVIGEQENETFLQNFFEVCF